MSDSRSISGRVTTVQEQDNSSVAYQMAQSLWWEKHQTHPNMSDVGFFHLVKICSLVLSGSGGTGDTIENWVNRANN